MTIEEIQDRLASIQKHSAGPERDNAEAHLDEDELYKDVLHAIANGEVADPQKFAAEAIKAADIKFDRWYE